MPLKSKTKRITVGIRKVLSKQRPVETQTQPASVSTAPGPQAAPSRSIESPAVVNQTAQPSTTSPSPSSTDESDKVEPKTEYQAAIEELHKANALLQQRHAAMKTQCESKAPKKRNPLERLTSNGVVSPVGNTRVSSLPSRLAAPSHQEPKIPATAKEACDALQRRQLIKDLAYHAIVGCEDAAGIFQELNAHYVLKARHQGDQEIPHLRLNINGVHVATHQLGIFEKNWISRVAVAFKLQSLADRKHLGPEDHEQIITQLFPFEAKDMLKPEQFNIFMTGLGTEGIITASEAKYIIKIAVSVEELEAGAHWTGTSRNHTQHQGRQHRPAMTTFDIPKQAYRTAAPFSAHPVISAQPELHHYLRVLVEAAVYDQKLWKGYTFTNPRSMLTSFYEAYALGQQGLLTPPQLTDYKRAWTHREIRLLQRGHLLCTLLRSFDDGTLTDYGIIRAVRGTFVRLPGQGYWDPEHLSTYLYHRVVDSGLSVSQVPEILALHPEHDADFANEQLGACVRSQLEAQAELFRQEEELRLSEIVESTASFEALKKMEMNVWERVCVRWDKWVGKKVVVVPFDPFAQTEET
jgi:hypothetical protein